MEREEVWVWNPLKKNQKQDLNGAVQTPTVLTKAFLYV